MRLLDWLAVSIKKKVLGVKRNNFSCRKKKERKKERKKEGKKENNRVAQPCLKSKKERRKDDARKERRKKENEFGDVW